MPIAWIVRILFVVVWAAMLAYLLRAGIPRGQTKLYVGAPTVVLVFAWAASEAYFDRRRKGMLKSRLEFLGFSHRASANIHYEPEDSHRNLSLDLNMEADWQGVPIRVTEFSFQQGSGKSATTHRYLQVAAIADDVPDFRLAPAGFLSRRKASKVTSAHMQETSAAPLFARRWKLTGPFLDEASEHFPEPLMRWLLEAPRYESWRCEGGELSCSWKRNCTPDQAEQLLERLASFLRLYRQ
ncbi:MAG: hypothetical protein KF805_16615 [Phycisphaeraceae bacterium]|nr:hypothetical protein [Phycisphaeraceae bacterium]